MYARQIDKMLRTDRYTRSSYLGVFPADRLPQKITNFPSALVVNTDPHQLPGSHWVAFYFTDKKEGEFMDSYGHSPGFYHPAFEQFLKRNSTRWTYNHTSLQHPLSDVCGQYAIFYVLHRSRQVNPNKIINMFGRDKAHNDFLVRRFIHRRYLNSSSSGAETDFNQCVHKRCVNEQLQNNNRV